MVALQELFTTDIGLLSLGVLLFIVGMAVWFARFFLSHIRQDGGRACARWRFRSRTAPARALVVEAASGAPGRTVRPRRTPVRVGRLRAIARLPIMGSPAPPAPA